ncbi:hypothetical protein CSC06_0660 [Escherichia coli]|nr:hypothetical protein CSC06_0660 [Escherichia coli]
MPRQPGLRNTNIQLLIGLIEIEEHFRSGTEINTPIYLWQGLTGNGANLLI